MYVRWEDFLDINGVTTINGKQYDNQLGEIDGTSMTNVAGSMINQLVNRGTLDVLEPKIDASHPETDGLPYQSANDMH